MKPTHLKTLSARIDEIEKLYQDRRISLPKYRKLILKAKENSELLVTLSIFVPCDENGKPLEKPSNHEKWLEYQKQGFELQFGNEAHNSQYHKAQQNVIFEGFKYDYFGNGAHKIRGPHGALYTFCANAVYYKDETLKTLSDLAAATIKNPLKLK